MKTFILAAAVAAALAAPSLAAAQTAAGPIICHSPHGSETANGTMGAKQLVCRPVNMARVRAAEKTLANIVAQHQMTAAETKQMNAAMASMDTELQLPAIPGSAGSDNY